MKRVVLCSLAFLVALQAYSVQAQNGTTQVKWDGISGKDNEVIVFMPKGYLANGKGESYMGRPDRGAIRVKKQTTAYRLINRVVLLFDYYEGNGPEIQASLEERQKLSEVKSSTYGSFKMKEFSGPFGNHFVKMQFYWNKDRVYVVKAITPNLKHGVATAFFESVRINGGSVSVAPNAPPGTMSTSIPSFVEKDPERGDDSSVLALSEADRAPVFIHVAKPKFGFEERRGLGFGKIKRKLLLSATGKVTNVEVVSASSKLLERTAIEAAKQTVFIPAEKDGRLVSVYQTVEQNFEVGIR